MLERIEEIHSSYEYQNFSVEELKKIKLIYEIRLLKKQLEG
jgi:hypothetical protein